jgi:hypothetical protein
MSSFVYEQDGILVLLPLVQMGSGPMGQYLYLSMCLMSEYNLCWQFVPLALTIFCEGNMLYSFIYLV